MLSVEQIERRKSGIGSSDIAAICGLSTWASPLDVWLAKTGRGPEMDQTKLQLRMGHALEPLIAELYSEQTGHALLDPKETFVGNEPWKLATPDRLRVEDRRPVECKLAFSVDGWGDVGTDDIPAAYICQVQWQLDAMGTDAADIAVIAGRSFRIYHVARDAALCEQLTEAARDFWARYVVPDVHPPVTGDDMHALAALFPRNNGTMLVSNEQLDWLAVELNSAKQLVKAGAAREELLSNQLRDLVGEHDGIQGEQWKCSWKRPKDSTKTDWEAVAREAGASVELISKHTTPKPGHRRFLFTMTKGA